MWPLGLLSIATVALAVMGFITVQDKKMLTPELVPTLEDALDRIRPGLAADGGNVELRQIEADGTVRVELQGACAPCLGKLSIDRWM